MRKAHVVDSIVVNLVEVADGADFVPETGAMAPDGPGCVLGAIWDGAIYAPPPDLRPLDEVKTDRLAALAAHRYSIETGGIVVAGMAVSTDERSKTLIHGARTAADKDATFTTRFKAGAASIRLTAPHIIAISDAVLAHVAACFDREGDLIDLIAAAPDRAALDAIDITAGWPG